MLTERKKLVEKYFYPKAQVALNHVLCKSYTLKDWGIFIFSIHSISKRA